MMFIAQPLISIIIPTYNRGYIIERAIQSVLKQTYTHWELWIVDDGSQDNTSAVVTQLISSLDETLRPRLHYLRHSQNCGVCVARNTGLEKAQGEYIAFLDSDDQWFPEKLEKQIQVFNQPEMGVVYTWLCFVDSENNIKKIRRTLERGNIQENLLYNNWVGSPSTVMIKRDCLAQGIRFDPELRCCEDWDFYLKLAQNYKFEVIPEPLVYYQDDTQKGMRATTNNYIVIEGHLIFLKRYHDKIRKNYQTVGSLTSVQKSNAFFNLGRRLICNAHPIQNQEAFWLGRSYLQLAYQVNPGSLRILFHYIFAVLGIESYVKFNQLESLFFKKSAQLLKFNS